MKIGIITFTIDNFGAQLQAFALQHKLSLLGYNAEICDVSIEPASKEIRNNAKRKEWLRSLMSRDFLRTIRRMTDKALKRVDRRINKSGGVGFKEFKLSLLKYSPVFSADYIRKNPNLYDVYIVGSDQVWSYVMSSILDIYFLNFTKKQSISYAASFGEGEIPSNLKVQYSEYLSHLDAISIRERQGVGIARNLTTHDIVKVVDPTFLLSKWEWEKLFDNTVLPDQPYVFVYDLIDSNYLTDYVMWLSKKDKLTVVSASGKTPQQFLALLAHAKHIVTTSFHGSALSINFGINFTTICRSSKSTNSRIVDICEDFGLSDHVLMEGKPFMIPSVIQYDRYKELLDAQIRDSLKFLVNNIKIKTKCQ